MAHLNIDRVYALADSVGMMLEYDPATGAISAKEDKTISLFGSPIRVPAEVVSSRCLDHVYMIMVKLVGNLALFVAAKRTNPGTTVVELHVLNLAKMDKVGSWLEHARPKHVDEALAKLKPAIVKSFVKLGKDKWVEAA